MKQQCYFAKVCDHESNKKHIGVNLFHCNFVFQDVVGYFFKICGGGGGVIARSFDKSRKLITLQPNLDITCIFKFSLSYEFYNR